MPANPISDPLTLAIIGTSDNEDVVQCHGRIVFDTTSSLKSVVKPLFSKGKTVVLDLTGVTFMDSSGLGTIASLYVSAKATHCRLRLINLNARLKELFRITRLGEAIGLGREQDDSSAR